MKISIFPLIILNFLFNISNLFCQFEDSDFKPMKINGGFRERIIYQDHKTSNAMDTNHLARNIIQKYDSSGNLIEVKLFHENELIITRLNKVDSNGLMKESQSQINQNKFRTTKFTYNYNNLNQLAEAISYESGKKDSIRQLFVYDSIGRISKTLTLTNDTSMIKHINKKVFYKYDNINRVSEIIRLKYDDSKDYNYKTTFKYNDRKLFVEKRIEQFNNIEMVDKKKPYERTIYNYDNYDNITEALLYTGYEATSEEFFHSKTNYIYKK